MPCTGLTHVQYTPHNHNMLRIKLRYSRNKYVFVFCVCVKLTKSTHLMFLCPVHGTLLPDISHCCSCRRLVTSLGIVLITNFTHTSKNCSIQIHDYTHHSLAGLDINTLLLLNVKIKIITLTPAMFLPAAAASV